MATQGCDRSAGPRAGMVGATLVALLAAIVASLGRRSYEDKDREWKASFGRGHSENREAIRNNVVRKLQDLSAVARRW